MSEENTDKVINKDTGETVSEEKVTEEAADTEVTAEEKAAEESAEEAGEASEEEENAEESLQKESFRLLRASLSEIRSAINKKRKINLSPPKDMLFPLLS